MIYKIFAFSLFIASATTFAGAGIDEMARWSNLAHRELKEKEPQKAMHVVKAMTKLTPEGGATTYFLDDNSLINLWCHNMEGMGDMCHFK